MKNYSWCFISRTCFNNSFPELIKKLEFHVDNTELLELEHSFQLLTVQSFIVTVMTLGIAPVTPVTAVLIKNEKPLSDETSGVVIVSVPLLELIATHEGKLAPLKLPILNETDVEPEAEHDKSGVTFTVLPSENEKVWSATWKFTFDV